MDWKLLAQLLVTFAVVVLGWWVGHELSARRDLANDRRKLRVTYLLEAYRKLEVASNRDDPKSNRTQLEVAIADVHLLGSSKQVKAPANSLAQWPKTVKHPWMLCCMAFDNRCVTSLIWKTVVEP